jgi:hypothetical protein
VCSSVYQSHTGGENESDYETEVDGRYHKDGFRGGVGPNAGFRNFLWEAAHKRSYHFCREKEVIFSYVSRENLARGMLNRRG